jgi:uncharacterized RDD family membrane protein YckC
METTTHTEHHAVSYAGFWKRLAAFVIDGVLIAVVLGILGVHSGPSYGYGQMYGRGYGMMPYAYGSFFTGGFLKIFCAWLYYAIMESSKHQGTVGKMILGIKVTDLHGNRIDFARATGRYFAKILSAIIFCIGYIMIAFTKHKQGLHDIIASTLVVNK